jgi:hypothetical protein
MIDSCANVSGRSEEDAGCRTRPRDDGTVRWRFRFRYDDSFSGMSLNTISEFASSTSASEWDDDDERRLDSSTRVPSSRVVSASNVGSPSERELSSVLVLVLLVLVVGEGRAAVLSRLWW